MVRAARRLPLLLMLLLLVPTGGASGSDDETGAPETARPGDHPLFAQLPPVPDATRLWAQMSSGGDAYFTLQKDVLPLPYTPPADTRAGPALTFEAFRHITLSTDTQERQYGSHPATTAWDARFHTDQPIVVEWLLSTGSRGTEIDAAGPPLLVKTTIKAIDGDGFRHLLAERLVRATPDGSGQPTPVRMTLDPLDRPIPAGSRLIIELDWSWTTIRGVGTLRQPLITVHPGSYIDLPIQDPVRIDSLVERRIDDDLYVQAKVAHLFAAPNIALHGANLIVTGPNLQAQGGRPYIQAPRDGPGDGHIATFDWRLPIALAHLSPGTYGIHVAVGQVNEPGPRVVGTTNLEIEDDDAAAEPHTASPLTPILLVAGLLAAVASPLLARRR